MPTKQRGLLDPTDLIGGAGGTGVFDPSDIFDSPGYRRQRMFDTLGGIGAALLQASGPGGPRRDFGSILGYGLSGGAQAAAGSQDKYLRRAMIGSQMAKNKHEMELDRGWQDLFLPPGAPAAPTDTASWAGPSVPATAPVVAEAPMPAMEPSGLVNAQPAGQSSDAQRAVQFLVNDPDLKMAPHQAAGLVGNLYRESTMRPDAAKPGDGRDGSTSVGLAQWNADRAQKLRQFAGTDTPDFDTQMKFLKSELLGSERPHFDAIRQTGNADDAAAAAVGFFRPLDTQGAKVNSAQFADAILRGGGQPPQASGPPVQLAQAGGVPVIPPQGDAVRPPGDASGNPVQPAQYQPPQPKTIQEVIQTIPPAMRNMISKMPRKEGMAQIMKYADPGSEAVLDSQTNQVIFVPKTVVGRNPRFQPIQGAQLEVDRGTLANRQRQTDNTIANAPVTIGPDGRPILNQQAIDAEAAKAGASAAAKVGPEVTTELAKDAIKRNSAIQTAGMQAQSSIGKLGAFNSLLDQVATGRFKGSITDFKAAAKGAGIDLEALGVTDDVAPAQALTALSNMMALENRSTAGGAGMPGAMSDADRAFLQQASPSITKDPAGNKILIAIKKGDLRRQVDVAKFASEYIKSPEFKTNPAGLDDYIAEKIGAKEYYDKSVLPQRSEAPPGAIPPPSAAPAVRRYNPTTGKIE